MSSPGWRGTHPAPGLRAGWARVWPALLAVGTVGAVGVPAAVASYRHARDVIAAYGDPVMAPFLPLSVDGMLVAALVVIWVRRHRGDRAGAFPWCAFGFGMVVTILANLAAVREPGPVAVAVALFPPLALAVTLELVALIAYRSAPHAPAPEPVVITHTNEVDKPREWWATASATSPVDEHQGAAESQDVDEPAAAADLAWEAPEQAGSSNPRVLELAGLLAEGASLTGAEVGARFGCSARTGRRLLTAAQDVNAERQHDTSGDSDSSTGLVLVTAGGA